MNILTQPKLMPCQVLHLIIGHPVVIPPKAEASEAPNGIGGIAEAPDLVSGSGTSYIFIWLKKPMNM